MFLIPQTKLTKYCLVLACCLTLEFNWIGNSSVGQDPSGPASTSRTTLSDRQTSVAARFEKLQELLPPPRGDGSGREPRESRTS